MSLSILKCSFLLPEIFRGNLNGAILLVEIALFKFPRKIDHKGA